MKLVYIAGPYTALNEAGVVANVRKAEVAGQEVLAMGLIPVIPHKITSHWDTWGILTHWTHEQWLENFCKPLLLRCDAIYLIEGWRESKGAKIEHALAIENYIPRAFDRYELERIFDL